MQGHRKEQGDWLGLGRTGVGQMSGGGLGGIGRRSPVGASGLGRWTYNWQGLCLFIRLQDTGQQCSASH